MSQNPRQSGADALIKKLHERPHVPLADWLRAPAHVHYTAFRMADPPAQRRLSREEFQSCLTDLGVPQDTMMLLALALHLDPVFVGSHHLARYVIVSLGVSFAAHAIIRRMRKDGHALEGEAERD